MKEKVNIIEVLKSNKIKIGILLLLVIIGIILVKLHNFYKDNNDIYIEVASENINYVYGPNNSTSVKMKVGNMLKVKIMTKDNKKNFVKCMSDDENVLKFKKDSSFEALGVGETNIYCKLNKNVSNKISVKVGN